MTKKDCVSQERFSFFFCNQKTASSGYFGWFIIPLFWGLQKTLRPRPNDDLLRAGQRSAEPAGKGMGFTAPGRYPQGPMLEVVIFHAL